MKHYIRSFGLGLLVSGLVMVAVYYFFDDSVNAKDMTIDDMKETMAEKGYRVMSEKEYIDLSVHKGEKQQSSSHNQDSKKDDTAKDKQDTDKNVDKQDKAEEEKKKTKSYTLHIKSGMPASKIGDMLQENDIIKDADKFNNYLEKHDYSPKVQLGKFKVNSDMDFKQLAKSFTR